MGPKCTPTHAWKIKLRFHAAERHNYACTCIPNTNAVTYGQNSVTLSRSHFSDSLTAFRETRIAYFEDSVFLGYEAAWWVTGGGHFGVTHFLFSKLKDESTLFFETSGNDYYPVTRRHIQQERCENLKTGTVLVVPVLWVPSSMV
jgi:hypothetical protein